MTRTCIVCRHKKRDDIDTDLLGNDTFRNIAARYSVSTGALQKHKKDHLIGKIAEVQWAKDEALRQYGKEALEKARNEVDHADKLLRQVQDLRQRALSLLDRAEESGDLRTALIGIREARGCIELLAKVEGQLDDRAQLNVNINPQWIELRTLIINALEPYADARQAVINALH